MARWKEQHRLRPQAFVAFVVALGIVFATGGTAAATTAPGAVYTIKAKVTNSSLELVSPKGKLSIAEYAVKAHGRVASFPRGAMIRFLFINHGTEPYVPALVVTNNANADPYEKAQKLFTANSAVKPGRSEEFIINFWFRGNFNLEKLLNKKPVGNPVKITVT
jgi:hypothetical protein